MKKLFFLITILIIFSSCSNNKPKLVDSKKETTVQIQQLAQADTTYYKVIELDSKTYILNNENMVVKINKDLSGTVNTLGLLLIITLMCLFFMTISIN